MMYLRSLPSMCGTHCCHAKEDLPLCLQQCITQPCSNNVVTPWCLQHFLSAEGLHPGGVAYDRPSPKLLAFLSKHYGGWAAAPGSPWICHIAKQLHLSPRCIHEPLLQGLVLLWRHEALVLIARSVGTLPASEHKWNDMGLGCPSAQAAMHHAEVMSQDAMMCVKIEMGPGRASLHSRVINRSPCIMDS